MSVILQYIIFDIFSVIFSASYDIKIGLKVTECIRKSNVDKL